MTPSLFDHTCRYDRRAECLACNAEQEALRRIRTLEQTGTLFLKVQIAEGLLPDGAVEAINEHMLRLVGAAVEYGRLT